MFHSGDEAILRSHAEPDTRTANRRTDSTGMRPHTPPTRYSSDTTGFRCGYPHPPLRGIVLETAHRSIHHSPTIAPVTSQPRTWRSRPGA